MKLTQNIAALALVALLAAPVLAQEKSWIHDDARVCTPAELGELARFSDRVLAERGVRLALVTLAETREPPKTIAVRTLNDWNPGPSSVFLLLSMNPRQLHVQPGTALAARFDEATASAICRDTIAPRLRAGERGKALLAGFEAIERHLAAPFSPAGPPVAPLAPAAPVPPATSRAASGSVALVAVAVVFGGLLCFLSPFVAVIWVLRRFGGRKCTACGERMSERLERLVEPTNAAAGSGNAHYSCACGSAHVEPYAIPMLTDTSSFSSDAASSSSYSSDAGSSSSGGDSGGSSSSGDGGGGSSW